MSSSQKALKQTSSRKNVINDHRQGVILRCQHLAVILTLFLTGRGCEALDNFAALYVLFYEGQCWK